MLSEQERRVLDHISEDRNSIRFLKRLINIDTQVPPGHNYDTICEMLSKKYSDMGCETEIYTATDKYLDLSGAKYLNLEGSRSNLVVEYRGASEKPILHISAHIDCAAIQEEGWTVDPLGGKVTESTPYEKSIHDEGGGYIWGRGAADDKGEIVAMTLALQAIIDMDVALRGELVLTCNCDEEIGGVAGLGFLIKEGIIKADMGIQLDGGLDGIGLAAMGRTRFLLRTHGKSYHGQMPILGVNAIEKMSKLNIALTDYWKNTLLKYRVPVPGIDLGEPLKKAGIDDLTAMLNIGTIKGGVQGATVPDYCEEEILRGMIPGETYETTRRELKEVLEGVKATDQEIKYDLEVINYREGYVVPQNDPYALECQGIITEAIGRKLPFTGTLASTDMNYQTNDGKMPCINFGVGGQYSRGHKQDENASIDEIIKCAKAVALIIIRKLGVN
jgi:succinyl-diaminopimelate desuccinylase